MTNSAGKRAAFLDRDGVINVDTGYVSRVDAFVFVDGVKDALAQLHRAGYCLIVVTNQSGIARGYYSEADFTEVTAYMRTELAAAGAPIARVMHCPHLPEQQQTTETGICGCRKPKPGMILAAAGDLQIDLAGSVMVGDKLDDVRAGRAAGVGRCYLVGAGQTIETPLADGNFADLAALVASGAVAAALGA